MKMTPSQARRQLALFASLIAMNTAAAQDLELFELSPNQPAGAELETPIYVTGVPGKDQRLFVVEQDTGLVRVINNNSLEVAPFLDLKQDIPLNSQALFGTTHELSVTQLSGFMSIAFHPDFEDNHRLFVSFTEKEKNTTDPNWAVVFEYEHVGGFGGFGVFKTETFRVQVHGLEHSAGALRFLPDGSLLFGVGDGFVLAGDTIGGAAFHPSQDIQDDNGKIHRLLTNEPGFSSWLPANPFPSNDTVWALGVRNPYSFEVAGTNLWVADVGDQAEEEVNRVKITAAGANYEWDCMEGTVPALGTCSSVGTMTGPIFTYGWVGGSAIIGGVVNDPSTTGSLRGDEKYFYANFAPSSVHTLDTQSPPIQATPNLNLPSGTLITGFGLDDAGGPLVVHYGSGGPDGKIYRIMEECDGVVVPGCVANLNTTGYAAQLCAADLTKSNGEALLASDQLRFVARNVPDGKTAMLYVNDTFHSTPFSSGAGWDCIGLDVTIVGHPVSVIGVAKTRNNLAIFDVSAPGIPGASAGVTLYFQVTFQETGAPHNLTDATALTFVL